MQSNQPNLSRRDFLATTAASVAAGSIIGAGAVITKDVAPFSVVAGVPARFLHWRDGYTQEGDGDDVT